MDSSRSESRAFSFAVSAMLTSAVLATAPDPTFVAAAAGPQPAAIMGMIEGARSAGFAGMKDMPAPAAVAAPAAAESKTASGKNASETVPTLTPAQLQKIRAYGLSPRGKQMGLRGDLAQALGVGPGGPSVYFPGMGASDSDVHLKWTIWILPNSSGYVIGRLDEQSGVTRFFRMDMDMKLVVGIYVKNATDASITYTPAEAAPLFAHDLTEWVDIADAIP
ncbi:MAG: hypothetical protein HY079_01355 [Elusimicrobia bacterium]|nr:hypothetical protein [Elusimicrobiota bacterium]